MRGYRAGEGGGSSRSESVNLAAPGLHALTPGETKGTDHCQLDRTPSQSRFEGSQVQGKARVWKSRLLDNRAKAEARLDLEASTGWRFHLLAACGAATLCCLPPALLETETLALSDALRAPGAGSRNICRRREKRPRTVHGCWRRRPLPRARPLTTPTYAPLLGPPLKVGSREPCGTAGRVPGSTDHGVALKRAHRPVSCAVPNQRVSTVRQHEATPIIIHSIPEKKI